MMKNGSMVILALIGVFVFGNYFGRDVEQRNWVDSSNRITQLQDSITTLNDTIFDLHVQYTTLDDEHFQLKLDYILTLVQLRQFLDNTEEVDSIVRGYEIE